MQQSQTIAQPPTGAAAKEPRVAAFICSNCTRGGLAPSARMRRPTPPAIPWQDPVKEVIVPCSGRLQPEHLLRTFEAGMDLVCVVACEVDNCHHLEGSCRAERRVEYVQGLLKEIGLDAQRLMLVKLPGSAREDMAAGAPGGQTSKVVPDGELARRIDDVAAQVARRLRTLSPNRVRKSAETQNLEV